MATKKQIEANRLNAQKSTGPRSVQGKARSSMNALRSGIDSHSQVIRGETVAGLEMLKHEYYDRFTPTTPEQRTLVDTLIDAEWLLRRFRVCEAQLWEHDIRTDGYPVHGTSVGDAFRNHRDEFSRLQRRIDNAHRNYRNALRELERLKAEEAARPEPDPDPAPPSARAAHPPQPFSVPNGFVPQTAPAAPEGAPTAVSRSSK